MSADADAHLRDALAECARLRNIERRYSLLAAAVNENSGLCSNSCDSHGHAEDCGYTDDALTLELTQQRAEAAERECAQLREQNERMRKALEGIATMPEYDQDDAHRLRDKAHRALEEIDATA